MKDREISPKGSEFQPGMRLCGVPGWNSDPKGEISLSYMNWLMMDYFFLTFPVILTGYIIPEKINFLRIVLT